MLVGLTGKQTHTVSQKIEGYLMKNGSFLVVECAPTLLDAHFAEVGQ